MSHDQSFTQSNSSPLKPGWAGGSWWVKADVWFQLGLTSQQSCELSLRLERSLRWSSRIGKNACALLLWAALANEICQCVLHYYAGLVWPSWLVGRCHPEGDETIGCCSLVASGVSCPCESQRRSRWPSWPTRVSEKHQHDPDSWGDKALKLFAQTFYPILFSVGLQ